MTEDILLRCLSVKVLFPLFRQEVLCLSVFFFQGSSYSFVLSVVGQRLFVHPVSPPSPQGPSYSSVYQFWPKTVLLSLSLYPSQRPLVHPCFLSHFFVHPFCVRGCPTPFSIRLVLCPEIFASNSPSRLCCARNFHIYWIFIIIVRLNVHESFLT